MGRVLSTNKAQKSLLIAIAAVAIVVANAFAIPVTASNYIAPAGIDLDILSFGEYLAVILVVCEVAALVVICIAALCYTVWIYGIKPVYERFGAQTDSGE
jgi:hypothetical protein